MVKKKNINSKKEIDYKRNAGFVIIFISVICLIIAIVSGGVWFSGLDIYENSKVIQLNIAGSEKKAEVLDESINTDEIFDSTYYNALNILSNTVGYGSTWLDICPNSQIEQNGEIFLKVCNDEYKTVDDIVNYLSQYFSRDFIEFLMGDYYIDIESQDDYLGDISTLYILPVSLNKNNDYVEMESYEVVSATNEKIVYAVTSRYSDNSCGDLCNDDFLTHNFTIVNENGQWIVDSMELPY